LPDVSRAAANIAPTLCLIVAAAENGVIGLNGKMPWHLPSELKYFRARTIGKPVIMGRKTFQSIGKPLPGRENIVVTRDAAFTASGAEVVGSLPAAIARAGEIVARTGASEIMVIGGGEIYALALPLANRVYLTRVSLRPEGDAFFPDLAADAWRLVSSAPIPAGGVDEPLALACVYERVTP
jgi:dihydrofolate reductase